MKGIAKRITAWFDTDRAMGVEIKNKEVSDKVDFVRIIPFIVLHLGCLGIIWVGWSPFALIFCFGYYFIRMFAITGFYHRYFSHKTFKTNRFWQFIFALLGASCVQRGALWWAAHHRHHHRYSDTEKDVHSPKKGFIMSHMGWIGTSGAFRTKYELIQDFAKYKELVFLNRFDTLVPISSAILIFLFGYGINLYFPGLNTSGFQMLIWGFFISTIVLFHGTVTINSLSHMWGSKRFETNDDSRNNFILSLVTLGEGWHNNHHYYPGTVKQGFYWWEIDPTYYGLRVLQFLGIIRDLRPVPKKIYQEIRNNKLAKAEKAEKVNLTKRDNYDQKTPVAK